jgi:hypothetical protein
MRRATALLLLPLLGGGCSSREGANRAFVDAGRQLRRDQPAPGADELRREVGSFLDNELPMLERKVDVALEREKRTWRLVAGGGVGLALVAATSGTLTDADSAVSPVLTGAGIAAALGSWAAYSARVRPLRACRAFLEGSRADLASWRTNAIPPGEGPVPVAVWQGWVDRVALVRGQESCAALR